MTFPALRAALLAYSQGPVPGGLAIDPREAVYVHRYPSGFQEPWSYGTTCATALARIEQLERELIEIYADPEVRQMREWKRAREKLGPIVLK